MQNLRPPVRVNFCKTARSLARGMWALRGHDDHYFFRTPASVLLRLCVALFAVGVSTALPGDAGAVGPAPPVCGAPRLFPGVLPESVRCVGTWRTSRPVQGGAV